MTGDPTETGLVLTHLANDAAFTRRLVESAGLRAEPCPDLRHLCCRLLDDGDSVGTLILAEETISSPDELGGLTAWLRAQPPWSDLPIVLLTNAGSATTQATEQLLALLQPVGVVTVLERPMRETTLITALQAALRARRRQYEVRDLLAQASRTAAALQATKTEAEAANRAKDQFLAVLSHELRTPLNAILGWTQLMTLDPDDSETRLTALDVIERNAKAQVQLIEDLLDVSRITTGRLRLEVRAIDPREMVQAALDTVRPAANARGVKLRHTPEAQSCVINADPDRLQQVVWNLLTNAIKFTPQGGQVHVRCLKADACFELLVEDTGQGIAPEFLPAVFDRFTQADPTGNRVNKGLGLGLAICRHLVELHGGVIFVTSPGVGQGSEFTLRLPLLDPRLPADAGADAAAPPPAPLAPLTPLPHSEAAPAGPAATRPAGDLSGIRVLVVDDDADARLLLDQLLSRRGAEVLLAASAGEAFLAVERMAPDVLLCDIEMPGEDGYGLIKRVRALPAASGGAVPAAALTAYAREEDRQRAILAGFQHHVAKPIDPTRIAALVASMARRPPARPA